MLLINNIYLLLFRNNFITFDIKINYYEITYDIEVFDKSYFLFVYPYRIGNTWFVNL